jgi:hypothetical protein
MQTIAHSSKRERKRVQQYLSHVVNLEIFERLLNLNTVELICMPGKFEVKGFLQIPSIIE